MRKLLLFSFIIFLCTSYVHAQRAVLVIDHMTPHGLTMPGVTTNSVSAGLKVIPKGTYAYFSAMNIADTNRVLTATYVFVTKPTGSNATFTALAGNKAQFLADTNGTYSIKLTITTATGTDDTTMNVYAANYVGVGNFEGIAAQFPQCMSCHGSMPAFTAIFDRWKVSGHAQIFKTEITTGPAYYSTSCMKCHTTGYDHNVVAKNNGFDDVATQVGWTWWAPPAPSKWDTLKGLSAGKLVNFATIGCENCHGAGSEHAAAGDKLKIDKPLTDGVCAQCHDEPWRHNKYSEFENSMHAEALYETGFATRVLTTATLSDCMRCHSGKGYIAFTKGISISTPLEPTVADHMPINCQTCHDPHGNTYTASLRNSPASSDTLGNGFNYGTTGGTGQTCFNCHKARRNSKTYVTTNISATWGPHYTPQADNLFAQNAVAVWDTLPFASSGHIYALANACVDCHMYATTDTGTVNRDKVGGHSFRLTNPANGYQHTKACAGCHGPKNSFADFVAATDYDNDGTVESVQDEVNGLLKLIRLSLPPVGQDTISWTLIRSSPDSVKYKKAYWNYQLIKNDGSFGLHNTKFAVSVLIKTVKFLNNGQVPVELMAFNGVLDKKQVNLTWETATETNNKGFAVERKVNGAWNQIAFVNGKGTTTDYQKYSYADPLNFRNDTKVVYRLKQVDFNGKETLSKEIEINYTAGPQEYALSQNYPNPFNPSTTINFTVPQNGLVKIRVYDAMGNLVKEVFNNTVQQGSYSAVWNGDDSRGSKAASGIYFYKLESANVTLAKKMILMK